MSLREYNALKKRYRAEHGENPPKGTKLDALRKLVNGGGSTTTTRKSTVKTTTKGKGRQGHLFWSGAFGRGGIR